ncbi:MAG: hypothetical protein J3Q66DRAFT_369413 [Benniella sp.]|nr:MAG: hypothetical protein J3Q66DRAFT_369413 [Benniella sp.]
METCSGSFPEYRGSATIDDDRPPMNESCCPGHIENLKTVKQWRSRGCMFEGPGQRDTDYSPTHTACSYDCKSLANGGMRNAGYAHLELFTVEGIRHVARVGFLESSELQGMMKATGHGARIFQESIVPVLQLFSTIVLNLESTNPVFVHSLTVDWLKQLITHCITDEKIAIAEQEMKEDRDLCYHHRHQRRVSTFASKVRVSRTLDISIRASQPCSEPITEPFFPLTDMHRFTPAFTRKPIWMSSCQRLSVWLDPLQS